MEIQISVRNLVEFILRSGSIDNRRATSPENAMQEGGRIHRMIQRRMGSDYQAEVPLSYLYETDSYQIRIDGRADGVLVQDEITIDEIKGTYRELQRMKDADPVHLAQAKVYAYIYAKQNELAQIRVRMTYCHLVSEEIRYFHYEYSFEELSDWFTQIMLEYKRWADFQFTWKTLRQDSIRELTFPFDYREGQKELVTYVYQTIYHKKKLFIEAPTGVGKTISTVFPSIKAMGEGIGQKIFYLTAKTITRKVADDTLEILRNRGLRLKSVVLTAKDKICFLEETDCNPVSCPYADGHYDRINDAVYDMLVNADHYDRGTVEKYAEKHKVCPFEMSLDVSLFCDMMICDYNYLFDPHVYLKRFFMEGVRGEYLFLIDEAHNLVDRGREMYSAVLCKEDILQMKRLVKDYDYTMHKQLEKCNHEMLELKRCCEDYQCLLETQIHPLIMQLVRLASTIENYLEDHEESPVRKEILDFYFVVSHFLLIYDKLDDHYVIYSQFTADNNFELKLFNVNPAKNLKECMQRGRSSILFSATLLPIQYYKQLLGADEEDYEVYAKSVFDPGKKGLFLANDVTSKYTRRNENEYRNIASYIYRVTRMRYGNYLIFFPSHAFLQKVLDIFQTEFADSTMECMIQEEYMNEQKREDFLLRFESSAEEQKEDPNEDQSLLGFCVLGGIFSEGIDLKEDRLIGTIIVGTGLPMVCNEREILKEYFSQNGMNGFDYAYRYPGMNKVLQAAGRVIRTSEDVGIVTLLDERFLTAPYLRMFPREWNSYEDVSIDEIDHSVERFWNEWL